ncbi:MAG: EamA/RhaT family transporter [Terriglobia bacterium]|nr:MAG: EamA/RhaT family transporter [Terriglobia bacterium]
MEASSIRPRLLLVAAALLFSTGGAAIKSATLTGWQVASFRSGVAAMALLIGVPESRRACSKRLIPVAAAYAATLVMFVLATRLTTAANAIFLQSTAPLYVLLLAPWLLQEHVRRSDLIYMLAVAAGMALFFLQNESAGATAPDPRRGNLIGAGSGVMWALTVTGLRRLGRGAPGNPAMATVALGNVMAFLAALPLAWPVTPAAGAANLLVILYLGIVQIGVAYVCVTRAIRHVPAFEATTILLLEPVMNPIWAWLVHGEKPGFWAVTGGAVILSATLWNTLRARLA